MPLIDKIRMTIKWKLGCCPHTPLFEFTRRHKDCIFKNEDGDD